MGVLLAGVLLLASPVLAMPVEGGSWWLVSAWESVVEAVASVFVGASEEDPEPESLPAPDEPTMNCVPPDCGTGARPSIDPDG